MEKTTSWVYFVQAGEGGPIKIGFTAGDPLVRMGALQTGNHEALRLVVAIHAPQAKEVELHKRFAAFKMKGEWFRPDPALLGFIEALQWASDFDRYQVPADAEARPYGMCEEQVRVVAGFMHARRLYDAAGELAEHFKGRGKLEADEVWHLLRLEGELREVLRRTANLAECPEDDGLRMFGALPLDVALTQVREALGAHGAARAEELLADDNGNGVAPWECEDADRQWAESLDNIGRPAPAPEEWN